jgi:hypothetical protein
VSLLLAWNELAETPYAKDRAAALDRMNQFVDTFAALRVRVARYVPRPQLRCRATLDEVELAVDYRIANWRNDTDRDRRKLFLQVITASPLLPTVEEGGSTDQYGSEATHRGRRAEGLHGAWVWSGVALSLASDECWNTPNVDIEVDQLDESGEVSHAPASVRHASARRHVRAHEQWLEEQARQSVHDAHDLWLRRHELFPHLEFCREIEGRLRIFDAGSPHFRQIILRLFDLDRAFAEWDRTPIHPEFLPSKCTPETPQTLEDEKADHTATRPSGERVIFSWHVRFTPRGGRIFFDADANMRLGIIGYVGMKKGAKLT